MKRILAILLALLLCCVAFAQPAEPEISEEHNALVLQAVEALKAHWLQDYQKNQPGGEGYLEIKNTRIFTIKDEPTGGSVEALDKMAQADFGEIEYIVEFMLLSDYFGTGPAYYVNACINDHVVFYADGSIAVSKNLFNHFRAKTFSNDFAGIIEETHDLGAAYNETCCLLRDA